MTNSKIAIVGLGGAGVNSLRNFQLYDNVPFSPYYTLALANKDNLQTPRTNEKAAFNPNPEALFESTLGVLKSFSKVYFIAGLGGSTASKILKRLATETMNAGKEVTCFVTTPFTFEGAGRARIAKETLAALSSANLKVVCFNNQDLFKKSDKTTTFIEAFRMVDEEIYYLITGEKFKKRPVATEPLSTEERPQQVTEIWDIKAAESRHSQIQTEKPQDEKLTAQQRMRIIISPYGLLRAAFGTTKLSLIKAIERLRQK